MSEAIIAIIAQDVLLCYKYTNIRFCYFESAAICAKATFLFIENMNLKHVGHVSNKLKRLLGTAAARLEALVENGLQIGQCPRPCPQSAMLRIRHRSVICVNAAGHCQLAVAASIGKLRRVFVGG